ncbi:hypothetical protein KKH43_01305 [Patescibacteria group bacterium]|nr:hypothetical protein [Patescibacteria group bacterium]
MTKVNLSLVDNIITYKFGKFIVLHFTLVIEIPQSDLPIIEVVFEVQQEAEIFFPDIKHPSLSKLSKEFCQKLLHNPVNSLCTLVDTVIEDMFDPEKWYVMSTSGGEFVLTNVAGLIICVDIDMEELKANFALLA